MGNINKKMQKKCGDTVLCEDWCIIAVASFLDFPSLGQWDIAMYSDASHREKWLLTLEKVTITGIDEYRHHYNESIRWLISRRIKHVTNISICLQQKFHEETPSFMRRSNCGCSQGIVGSKICGKTFCGAHRLVDLKSIVLENKRDSHTFYTSNGYYHEPSDDIYEQSTRIELTNVVPEILDSLSVNCKGLEHVEIKCDSTFVCFDAAARLVKNLPRLRNFTFTYGVGTCNPQLLSVPLILALAQHCPLLETLNLGEYHDELDQLVADCPKLHTITLESAYVGVNEGRALGRSRSITTLHFNTWFAESTGQMLAAMADEGWLVTSFI